MGRCEHPECEEPANRRLFLSEAVYEYCLDHYEAASAIQQAKVPRWEAETY